MSNKWKDAGFSQKRPVDPGVYYVKTDRHLRLNPSPREIEGWDLCEVRYTAGGWGNELMNREDGAHWRVHTLGGIDRAWHKGMWLKGPISPFVELARENPNTNPVQAG